MISLNLDERDRATTAQVQFTQKSRAKFHTPQNISGASQLKKKQKTAGSPKPLKQMRTG